VRLATWNVNSIGARMPRFLPWLEEMAPDVVAVQETKTASFPDVPGYEVAHAGDGRWNGVAILSRIGLTDVDLVHEGHPETRLVSARCGPIHVTSVYVPNGRSLDDPHYAYKLAWLAELRRRLDRYSPSDPLVVMGDFNVARTDEDVWDIKAFRHSTHVTPAERKAVDQLVDWGLVDVVPRPGKGDRPSPTGTTGLGCSTRTSACGSTTCSPPRPCRSSTPGWTGRPARAPAPATTPR
jgi:exodeoxyribonuclease III